MQKAKILTITALIVLLALHALVLSASATNVPSFSVARLSQLPIELPAGTTFNGSIAASGTIRFWVSAPDGAQVTNLGLVAEPAKFSFVASKEGNYTFNFENDIVGSNPVQINFSFTTNPDISSGDQSQEIPLSVIIAIVVIGVVGSVLIFVTIRRGERRKNRSKI